MYEVRNNAENNQCLFRRKILGTWYPPVGAVRCCYHVTPGDQTSSTVELTALYQRYDPGELVHFSHLATNNPLFSVRYTTDWNKYHFGYLMFHSRLPRKILCVFLISVCASRVQPISSYEKSLLFIESYENWVLK